MILSSNTILKHPDSGSIYDKDGNQYSVSVTETGITTHFSVKRGRISVGRAYLNITSDGMELSDLLITDDAVLPSRSFLERLFGRQKKGTLRKTGVGSAVLQFIIAYAKRRGVPHLEGKIMRQDVLVTPDLAKWYQKRGFTVIEQRANGEQIGKIVMDLIP